MIQAEQAQQDEEHQDVNEILNEINRFTTSYLVFPLENCQKRRDHVLTIYKLSHILQSYNPSCNPPPSKVPATENIEDNNVEPLSNDAYKIEMLNLPQLSSQPIEISQPEPSWYVIYHQSKRGQEHLFLPSLRLVV